MCGSHICPTKKQRPEFWLAWLARHLETSAIANPSAKAFPRCVFTSAQGIGFITREPARPFTFCWPAASKPRKRRTLSKRNKWLANSRGRNHEEKENDLQTIRRGGISQQRCGHRGVSFTGRRRPEPRGIRRRPWRRAQGTRHSTDR